MFKALLQEIKNLSNHKKAVLSQKYFKTGKGEYGEGDVFIGITVPVLRSAVKKYTDLPLSDIKKLLASHVHEHRSAGLMILVSKYEIAIKNSEEKQKKKIVDFYLAHKRYVNNWDLVDSSAEFILGDYLLDKPKDILYKLATSKSVWDRRIAIISTFGFIKKRKFNETLKISKMLLSDKHDLIHKAVGWMLREIGKRDNAVLLKFLDKNIQKIPRTLLRYAIERMLKEQRLHYLSL